jgi:hypothetical protein
MTPDDVDEFMAQHDVVQINQIPAATVAGVVMPKAVSVILKGGRWLHGPTLADILKGIKHGT